MGTVSKVRIAGAAAVVAVGAVSAAAAFASPIAADGPPSSDSSTTSVAPGSACTPGFWKNHEDGWGDTGFSPDEIADAVFAGAAGFELDAETLLESLAGGGGPGADGAAQILLRAAVASLLNAGTPDGGFSMSTDELIAAVNAALDSGDRATMLALAGDLDGLNNAGDCMDAVDHSDDGDLATSAAVLAVEIAAGPPSSVPVGPPASVPVGPPDGAGPPESVPVGPPDGAGPPENVPAGPPDGVPATPPSSVPVGPPADVPAGPPEEVPAGPPASVPVGPPASVPAGPPAG
jgi:hypothetical protein